ncbi:MAG TPA: asparagine synthase (glutamine-hydrolyzing), partial [Calditrichia bacterium]|nr:asparagine synthase (glutamine-hydrolyzing) [Calditrichia bacterium]
MVNLNGQATQQDQIIAMMREMKHRGPNDEGFFIEGNTGLGFVRLSILDLSAAGHQPMFSRDERYVIIFNGEIYNYIELREELAGEYSFKSNTDTEVLLAGYLKWGEALQDRLNGMWALAIYDRREKSLFISRDRFGIKPLYYFLDSQQLIFASEFSSILKVLPHKPGANDQIIFDYLTFNRTNHTENTFFDGIKKLQHGHCMNVRNGQVAIRRWYDLTSRIGKPFTTTEDFRETLEAAIQIRMRSDVPVGACLSGGLDSATIVSLIQQMPQFKNVHSFSAVYGAGQQGDESDFINEFRDSLENMHFINPTAASLFNDLDAFVRALEEPVPSTSIYALFRVMELAKDTVTVLQNGQGADELLAGYDYFFGFFFKELLLSMRWMHLAKELKHYSAKHRSAFALKYLAFLLLPTALRLKGRVASK